MLLQRAVFPGRAGLGALIQGHASALAMQRVVEAKFVSSVGAAQSRFLCGSWEIRNLPWRYHPPNSTYRIWLHLMKKGAHRSARVSAVRPAQSLCLQHIL